MKGACPPEQYGVLADQQILTQDRYPTVWGGVVSVWQAEAVLQPATRIPPQPATPKRQHTSKHEHTLNVVMQ